MATAWIDTTPDGLATLGITGPAIGIHALRKRIVEHADALKDAQEAHLTGTDNDAPPVNEFGHHTCAPEERTIGQWRLATALGLANNPADMPGYGPLDPDLARQLAASADWKRWITDPITGYLLDDGNRRLPTAALARFINARDARCDAPPCGKATRLDIDHIPTYAQARTTRATTLTRTCPRHNRSREKAGWTTPDSSTWVTDLGRHYTTRGHQVLPTPDPPEDDPPPF